MKTKILFTFLLLATIAYNASAITITIQGGGHTSRFNYIRLDDKQLTCKGRGSLVCPIDFSVKDQNRVAHKVDGVVDFVNERIAAGEKSGKVDYEKGLPVSWKMMEDETVQIDIADDGSTQFDSYEESDN